MGRAKADLGTPRAVWVVSAGGMQRRGGQETNDHISRCHLTEKSKAYITPRHETPGVPPVRTLYAGGASGADEPTPRDRRRKATED
jgi:hypothetical protein|eukprot:1215670-Prymnesium_polylepis.1